MPAVSLADGLVINYREGGSGGKVPLLLCHGSGGSSLHWSLQLRGLQGLARPIALDLPGHGSSGGLALDSISGYRAVLRNFANTLGLPPFILGGHSMGGAIALDYALNHPDDLLGLVLIGAGARLRVLPSILESLRRGVTPDDLYKHTYSSGADPALFRKAREEMDAVPPAVFLADLTACDRFEMMEQLPLINLPTLVICGVEDRLTPPKYSSYLQQKLPRAELSVIEGAGHMLIIEKPDETNQVIGRFIQEIAVR